MVADSHSRHDGPVAGPGTLTDEQRAHIRSAAESDLYRNSPVPASVLDELDAELCRCVDIPYAARSRLANLYPAGIDPVSAVREDWNEAFQAGALRRFSDSSIDFPLRYPRRGGGIAEASIKRRTMGEGLGWILNFIPDANQLSIPGDASSSEPNGENLPDQFPDAVDRMKQSEEYRNGSLDAELLTGLEALGCFSDFVHLNARWRDELFTLAAREFDTTAFLNREWAHALEVGALREYEGKVTFPVSIFRADRETLVEVTIKRDDRADRGFMPWFVNWVDSVVRNRIAPGRALETWAVLDWSDVLEKLSDLALDETWSFDGGRDRSILKSYLSYTFYRLQQEGKVLEDAEHGMAAFNTGLVTNTYEPIYACFSPTHAERAWRFSGFCRAGSRGLGKELVRTFHPLPQKARYFERKEDLLFDASRDPQLDYDHILIDNIDRLPQELLEEELRSSPEATEALEEARRAYAETGRNDAFDALRDIMEADSRLERRLIRRLDDAVDVARKRADWNYRTAVPCFFPSRSCMSLLLPLDFNEDGTPDVALVLELTESGTYLGQTILTMRMAYNNARLVCRPDSDWLDIGAGWL